MSFVKAKTIKSVAVFKIEATSSVGINMLEAERYRQDEVVKKRVERHLLVLVFPWDLWIIIKNTEFSTEYQQPLTKV